MQQLSCENNNAIESRRYPSTAQLQRLFRTSLDLICSIDGTGRFVHVSDACQKILGFAPEEITGCCVSQFLHPEDICKTIAAGEDIRSGGGIVNFENRYRKKDGTFVVMNWSCHWDEVEALMFCMGRNVTERTERELLQTQYEKKVKQQNRQLNEMLNRITDCFIAMDSEWRIVYANQVTEKVLSVKKEDYLSRNFWECFPQMIDSVFYEEYRKAMSKGVSVHFEGYFSPFSAWFAIDAFPSESGLSVFFRDVTAKRKANEERQRTEEELSRLSLIVKEATDAVSIVEKDGRITWVNDAYSRLFGYGLAEVIGKRNSELLGGAGSDPRTENEMKLCVATGQQFKTEILAYTKKGEPRWLEATGQPLIGGDGQPAQFFVFKSDITLRKNAEDALRLSNERFRLAAMTDPIYDWNIESGHLYWGEGLKDQFGYHSDELQMDTWLNAVHPDERQIAMADLARTLADPGTTVWEREYRIRHHLGMYCYAYERGHILRNDKGKAIRMVGVMQNITERKHLQQQLESNVRHQQKEITTAVIKAQERERAEVGRELHDNVNQILTSVKLYQELVLSGIGDRDELTKKSIDLLREVINENRRLSKQLSAPTLGNSKLADTIQELVDEVAATRKFELSLDAEDIRDLTAGEELHLGVYRIVQEHLTNVLKYASASRVTVIFSRAENDLLLKIADNGVGFDPTQKRSGIGVTNMRMRAENLGGKLTIDSAPNKGCLLTVSFPLSCDQPNCFPVDCG